MFQLFYYNWQDIVVSYMVWIQQFLRAQTSTDDRKIIHCFLLQLFDLVYKDLNYGQVLQNTLKPK